MSRWLKSGLLSSLVFLAACQPPEPVEEPVDETVEPELVLPDQLQLIPAHWDALRDWQSADPLDGISAFLRSCERWQGWADDRPLNPRAEWAGTVGDWRAACAAAMLAGSDAASRRAALEAAFQPIRITAIAEDETVEPADTGLLTGYYEPFVEVRERGDSEFSQPLRRRPDDLVTVDLGRFDEALAGRRLVGRVEGGELVFYRDRDEIERQDRGDVIAWGRPIDVFFLQIQGSGRLVYPDGHQERAAFAAHNGLPYRSIGRELIRRGELERHAASKQGIERWLNANGPEATAELFAVNPRYVFFQTQPLTDPDLGPAGSAGLPLTPMASIAVDTSHHAHGVPIWLTADLPELDTWSGLVVAQDSGGAINGPIRGDFFWGWGADAERRAGTTRAQASWYVLLPTAVAQRIIDATPPA